MGLVDIIKKIVEMLPEIMLAGGLVFLIGMFILIIGGAFEQQAADGNIPVDGTFDGENYTGTVAALHSTQEKAINSTNTVSSQVQTTVNYLPLIVIMLIAVGFLGFLGIKKFKEGGL